MSAGQADGEPAAGAAAAAAAAAELDPAHPEEEEEEQPIPEDAEPGQVPPAPAEEEAALPGGHCQAWLLAPLEDARFLICCTNWY
ncbi:protein MMP24OS [Vipera latastei]